MPTELLHVITGGLTGDAALDTATSRAILQRVNSGDLPPTLQVGMPHRVVAFGKHDTLAPGFPNAVDIALDHGYDPTVRIAGGRAVVFHPGTVRFAWTVPVSEPARTMHERFAILARAVVETLGDLDIDARVGELPDEYCAGTYSVHLAQGGKIMGIGQRLARNAAQVGGMIVITDSVSINEVLGPIYSELGIAFDPHMTGALSDVHDIDPYEVGRVFSDRLSPKNGTVASSVDATTRLLATSLRRDHVPEHLRERTERP